MWWLDYVENNANAINPFITVYVYTYIQQAVANAESAINEEQENFEMGIQEQLQRGRGIQYNTIQYNSSSSTR